MQDAQSKHTPGPWRQARSAKFFDIVGADGVVVTEVTPASPILPEDVQQANARLIAAAPTLLAALIAARLVYIDQHAVAVPEELADHPVLVIMDAAIAAAGG